MLVIIDPSLKSFDGHFYTYDVAIANELKKLDRECVVLASRSLRLPPDPSISIIPCFRYSLEERVAHLADLFYADLDEGVRSIGQTGRKTLFLHTCTPAQIEASARFIKRNPQYDLIILLRYSITISPTNPDTRNVAAYQSSLNSIEKYGVSDRVRLITDSEQLSDEYQLVTRLPIGVVPIPHVASSVHSPEANRKTVVYLGNARSSKGFAYLQHATAKMRPLLHSGEWAAEFQANVMFEDDRESVVALAALRNEPVTLWERELSPIEYEDLLGRATLVLIPYMTAWYHVQTSGVFAEAVGAGRPVVIPRGTWMSRQLADSGAGMLFNPGDRLDFSKAVSRAIDRIDELLEKADELRGQWCKHHNPGAFAKALLQC